jgi:ATP-dependent DNA helicase RecG
MTENDAERTYRMIGDEIDKGRQCYVVYPLIEESEKLDLRSATEGLEKLTGVFPKCKVALLHGRLKSDEKDAIMRAFASGNIQILVSTTVIEVGVDVANATVMLIENAERSAWRSASIARARGQARHRSVCVLKTSHRLSDAARERIPGDGFDDGWFRLGEVIFDCGAWEVAGLGSPACRNFASQI